MIEHTATVHLNRPVEQVFAFVSDTHNLHTWQSNLIESQQLSAGPIQAGTRIREVRRLGRRPSQIEAEMTVFEVNKRFATQTVTKPSVMVSYEFEAEDGGTRLTYTFTMLTHGMMWLLQPLIAGAIKRQTRSDFQRLKHVLKG